jgi:hypothetical protein
MGTIVNRQNCFCVFDPKMVAAVLPKVWYLPIALRVIIFQITVILIFMMVGARNPIIHNSGQPEHIAEKSTLYT